MMQLFWGMRLKMGEQIKDDEVVSPWQIRIGNFQFFLTKICHNRYKMLCLYQQLAIGQHNTY